MQGVIRQVSNAVRKTGSNYLITEKKKRRGIYSILGRTASVKHDCGLEDWSNIPLTVALELIVDGLFF